MWYLSLAAEGLLLWSLGWRSPWGRYLTFDLARAAVLLLIGVKSVHYTQAWIITEPVSIGLQFAAIAEAVTANVRSDNRLPRWLFAGASVVALAAGLMMAPGFGWAFSYRWMLLGRHIAVGIGFLVMLLGYLLRVHAGLPGQPWLLAYFGLQAANVALIRGLGPEWIRPLNTVHAVTVGAFFLTWAIYILRAGIPGTARPR